MSEDSSIEWRIFTELAAWNRSNPAPTQPPNEMADHPYHRSAEAALSRLANFRTQNPLRSMTAPAAPSLSPGLPSPLVSPITSIPQQSRPTPNMPQFHPSRMNIPPTAYAPAYASAHQISQANHMPPPATQSPSLRPPEPQAYEPLVHPESLACLTYNMVYDRVYLVLRDSLSEWWTRNPDAIQNVSQRLAGQIRFSGQRGMFGPDGIQSLNRINMFIGREGIYRYLCLAVLPNHGELAILLKGDLCEKDGNDPMYDEELLAMCKEGFDKVAVRLHADIVVQDELRRARTSSHGVRVGALE